MGKKEGFCPARNGTFTGYHPEYRMKQMGVGGWTEWLDLPVKRSNKTEGVPYPELLKGVLIAIDLFGLSQAKALAWDFLAHSESKAGLTIYQIRVQPYDISYDIKAKKTGDPKPENETEHLE